MPSLPITWNEWPTLMEMMDMEWEVVRPDCVQFSLQLFQQPQPGSAPGIEEVHNKSQSMHPVQVWWVPPQSALQNWLSQDSEAFHGVLAPSVGLGTGTTGRLQSWPSSPLPLARWGLQPEVLPQLHLCLSLPLGK